MSDKRVRLGIAIAFVALVLFSMRSQAQPPSVTAIGVDDDSDIAPLDEATWSRPTSQSLTQRVPHPGETTEFATRVRFLTGKSHLYIRVDCDDPRSADIVTHSLLFDGDQSFDDHLVIVLDTFDKHRTAYEFDVNAAGSRSDGLISPAAILTNYDWNGDWRATVTRSASQWTAYIAINTRSLQFPQLRRNGE